MLSTIRSTVKRVGWVSTLTCKRTVGSVWVHHLCHIALSIPRANASMRPRLHETAAGVLSMTPPSDSQPRQPPANHLCHSALSIPRANTSIRPDDHDVAAGSLSMTPPSDSQPLQPPS